MNIEALRSTASSACSDATVKEGHVNHDVSDVPVKVCANPMTGSGWYSWVLAARRHDVKLFFLLSLAHAVMAALRTPPPTRSPLLSSHRMLATEALITLRLQLLPLRGRPGAGVLRAWRRGVGFFSLSHDDDKLASADASESCLRDMT